MVNSEGKKKGGIVEKRKKARKMQVQPGAPKKNLTSYMIFCSEERAKGNITTTPNEQAVELGRRWRSLSPEEKNIFNEKAKREKERYQRDRGVKPYR